MDEVMMISISIAAWIAGILFAAYVFAAVFAVKKSRWIQQKQLDVLIAMAHRAGMTEDELQEIMNRKVN